MHRSVLAAFLVLSAFCGPAVAQDQVTEEAPPPAPPRTMVGSWEFSSADRERLCTIIFRNDTAAVGKKVEFDRNCANVFPFVRDVAGWTLSDNDFLRLLDAKGNSVLEFSEVENGIFEAPKPGEGILFIQNAASTGPAPRTAAQMTGEWTVQRGGKAICPLMLSSTAAGEEFAVQVKQPCDRFVTTFAPVTWQMDRGELVLRSARGQTWRFELGDESNWRRIPGGTNPVLMVRK